MENKLAICYTCCGPTYRETAKRMLVDFFNDDDEIFYFVITDDEKYFDGIKRKNLIVKNLKEFYPEYPHIEKYEHFLESETVEEYGRRFISENYKFPFSVDRLNFILAKEHGIKNVLLLNTDTEFYVERYKQLTDKDNILYNYVTRWDQNIKDNNMGFVVKMLNEKFNLEVSETVRIYDAAARLFCFESVDFMMKFFNIWDTIVREIYESNKVNLFWGRYAVNNEYILAPIYNAIGIKGPDYDVFGLFNAKHDPKTERFWMQ